MANGRPSRFHDEGRQCLLQLVHGGIVLAADGSPAVHDQRNDLGTLFTGEHRHLSAERGLDELGDNGGVILVGHDHKIQGQAALSNSGALSKVFMKQRNASTSQ